MWGGGGGGAGAGAAEGGGGAGAAWHAGMCLVASLNLGAYAVLARRVLRGGAGLARGPGPRPALGAYQRTLLALCGPWVAVCAWRSFLPSIYVSRVVWAPTILNAVLLHRTAASFAEVCGPMCLMLAVCAGRCMPATSGGAGGGRPPFSALCAVVLTILAEPLDCLSTITTDNSFSVIVSYLWAGVGLCNILTGVQILAALREARLGGRKRAGPSGGAAIFGACLVVFGLGYLAYMLLIDGPRYIEEWRDDQAHHKKYFSFWDGVRDSMETRHVRRAWSDWKNDAFWMTSYFSLGVWGAFLMVWAVPHCG